LGGGDIVGMASMFHVALQTLEFVASRARPFFADTAFPLTAQEPTALGIGTSPHKMGAFRTDDISSIEQSIGLDRHFHDPSLEFQHFGPDLFGFDNIFDNHLGSGQESAFLIKEYLFAVFAEGNVDKGMRESLGQELAGPWTVAIVVHAFGLT